MFFVAFFTVLFYFLDKFSKTGSNNSFFNIPALVPDFEQGIFKGWYIKRKIYI
jgi:hypothetical protein